MGHMSTLEGTQSWGHRGAVEGCEPHGVGRKDQTRGACGSGRIQLSTAPGLAALSDFPVLTQAPRALGDPLPTFSSHPTWPDSSCRNPGALPPLDSACPCSSPQL